MRESHQRVPRSQSCRKLRSWEKTTTKDSVLDHEEFRSPGVLDTESVNMLNPQRDLLPLAVAVNCEYEFS